MRCTYFDSNLFFILMPEEMLSRATWNVSSPSSVRNARIPERRRYRRVNTALRTCVLGGEEKKSMMRFSGSSITANQGTVIRNYVHPPSIHGLWKFILSYFIGRDCKNIRHVRIQKSPTINAHRTVKITIEAWVNSLPGKSKIFQIPPGHGHPVMGKWRECTYALLIQPA